MFHLQTFNMAKVNLSYLLIKKTKVRNSRLYRCLIIDSNFMKFSSYLNGSSRIFTLWNFWPDVKHKTFLWKKQSRNPLFINQFLQGQKAANDQILKQSWYLLGYFPRRLRKAENPFWVMTHTTTHNFIITIKFQGTSVFGLSLTPDLSKAVDLKIELLGVHTNRESHLQRLSLPIKMGMEGPVNCSLSWPICKLRSQSNPIVKSSAIDRFYVEDKLNANVSFKTTPQPFYDKT